MNDGETQKTEALSTCNKVATIKHFLGLVSVLFLRRVDDSP